MIADRYLGLRKAIIFGAVLLVVGHLGMAYEGPPAVMMGETVSRSVQHEQAFYLALSFIVVGVGFLKANISTIVGGLYGEGDPRRDGGLPSSIWGSTLARLWRPFCVLIWAKPMAGVMVLVLQGLGC